MPSLWMFTDSARLPDPLAAARRLPIGRAGIVFRHDGAADRAEIGKGLARICRQRRLILVIAGDSRLSAALGAGMHLRGGRWPDVRRRPGFVTASAHGVADLQRCRRAGVDLAFLSPVFATASHPGAASLGIARGSGWARRAPVPIAALGGIDGRSVRALPGFCSAAAAIGAFAP